MRCGDSFCFNRFLTCPLFTQLHAHLIESIAQITTTRTATIYNRLTSSTTTREHHLFQNLSGPIWRRARKAAAAIEAKPAPLATGGSANHSSMSSLSSMTGAL